MNLAPPPDSAPMLRARLSRVLHPLAAPPTAAAWNEAEIGDLLPPGRAWMPAAVLIPIIPHAAGATVLLTQRTAELTHHAGQVSFPGGRIETDDRDAAAAAIREAHEEIGLAPAEVEPLGYLDRYLTITGFIVTPTIALVRPGAAYRPDAREVADAFEVPLSFLLDARRRELRSRELAGRVRRYHVYPYQGREIWGATAAMIVNLAERLGADA